jgi:leader peptidase (prepilin peptidase)/N-methyltransferase
MLYPELLIALVIGLIIGSFLNVLIFRADNLKTIFYTRSECPKCHHKLNWKDLIPVISFFILRRRCRYCGKPISWQYPLVEAGTGLTLLLLAWFLGGLTLSFFFYALIFSLLIVVFVYDFATQFVPEEYVWIALILAIIGGSYFGHFSFKNMIFGGLVAGGFPALLVVISREHWMGAGDIKISLILGLLLGYPKAIIGMFVAFFLGAIIGVAYIYLGKKTMKDTLPFGPFLITATLICLIFGDYFLIRYYDWFRILY